VREVLTAHEPNPVIVIAQTADPELMRLYTEVRGYQTWLVSGRSVYRRRATQPP